MPLGHDFGSPPLLRNDDPGSQFAFQQHIERLTQVARRLSFLDTDGGVTGGRRATNLDAVWVAYVSNGTANTEDTVAHNLGRIPVGLFVGLPDKSAVIYNGTTTWTSTNIFLRASAATVTVNLLVF